MPDAAYVSSMSSGGTTGALLSLVSRESDSDSMTDS